MKSLILVMSALCLTWPVSALAVDPAQKTAQAFYTWVMAHPDLSLPSADERAELSGMLSPALLALLTSASETEQRCIDTAQQGDKPLVLEGQILVGVAEGATEVAFGDTRLSAHQARIDATVFHIDERFPKGDPRRAVASVDAMALGLHGVQWRVDDIRLGKKTSLQAVLKNYVAEGARWCVRAKATRP